MIQNHTAKLGGASAIGASSIAFGLHELCSQISIKKTDGMKQMIMLLTSSKLLTFGQLSKFIGSHLIATLTAMLFTCCSSDNEVKAQTMTQKLYITIDGMTKTATMVDNAATLELVARLQQAPVTVTLNSSGGFEIWGALGFSLTTSNEQVNAQPGDIVLYNGSNICMFYGTNSWSYTRLGHIDGLSENVLDPGSLARQELKTFLHASESNISVMLSLNNTTGISQVRANVTTSKAYTLQGTLAQAGYKGIVIQNGKKIIR